MADKKPVSFRFPEPLIAQLKARATEEGISVTELISRFSQQGLDGSTQERLAALERQVLTAAGSGEGGSASAIAPSPHPEGDMPRDECYRELIQVKQQYEQLTRQIRQVIPELHSKIARLEAQLSLQI